MRFRRRAARAPGWLALCLAAASAAPQGDPLERLGAWLERTRLAPRSIDGRRVAELQAILGDLRILRAGNSAGAEHDLRLVELASLEWRPGHEADAELRACARLGRGELEDELARGNGALAARLAREVLAPAAGRPRAERLLCAELLERAHEPASLAELCALARGDDSDLAAAARRALCGWPEAGVHAYFLAGLARGEPGTRAAAEHFARVGPGLAEPVLEALEREVARRYLSEDWREAARARGLARALDLPRGVPILIEALAVWDRRTRAGEGSRRIRSEVLAELQRLSGRALRADPGLWSEWWAKVRAGEVLLPEEIGAAGGQPSSATFFGLKADTDRVLFVVDRSSSMDTAFGTSGRTRHAEAIDQLERFLRQSGAETRFTVAVFSDRGLSWRARLAPATEANLSGVRRWLEQRAPEGETRLFEGLRAGLDLDARGRLALADCQADTVIVLCDGKTTDGTGWVARWLAEENEERAELVFHCVQIGSQGDGTLEALSSGSGGVFVRVPG
jgi:hypothetical protein